jgi:hypothetical protein
VSADRLDPVAFVQLGPHRTCAKPAVVNKTSIVTRILIHLIHQYDLKRKKTFHFTKAEHFARQTTKVFGALVRASKGFLTYGVTHQKLPIMHLGFVD